MVPADNKWYTRQVVAAAIMDALSALDLAYPRIATAKRAELDKAREELLAESGPKRRKERK